MAIQRQDNVVIPLLSAPQTFTTGWVDLGTFPGPELDVMDCTSVALWLDLIVHSSANMRVRMIPLQVTGSADLYTPVITDTLPSVSQVEPEYIEFNQDADQKVVLSFPTVDLAPYIKFQIQVGTAGVTPAVVNGAGVSFKSTRAGA